MDAVKEYEKADRLLELNKITIGQFDEMLKPLRDVEPVRHGKWLPCTKQGLILTELERRKGQKWYGFKCNKCGHIYKGNALRECPYCQNCGAKMGS